MISRNLLLGIAASAMFAAPALAAPPAATSTSAPAATATATPAAKPADTAKPKMSSEAKRVAFYKKAQEKLKDLNLYSGPVDGHRSPTFVKSVESFQKEHKLKVTGLLSSDTQKALGI